MKNPCVLLRERCGINQKDFAAKYGFHKTTMVYWDAGMYPEISVRMNNALARECAEKGVDAAGELLVGYGEGNLDDAYAKWQLMARVENAQMFYRPPTWGTPQTTPFYQYIYDTTGSLQSFCKHLLVPAASVLRYAKGHTVTMPEVVENALEDIRYPDLDVLKQFQQKWLETHV